MPNLLDACTPALLLDVNPACAKHELVVRSVHNLPDTKFADHSVRGSCLLNNGVC